MLDRGFGLLPPGLRSCSGSKPCFISVGCRATNTLNFLRRFYSAKKPRVWRQVKSMAEIREVMDIRAASEYLGISMGTLYRYVHEEKIPAFKLGNRWKFKKS